MARITQLVLDILKPHHPDVAVFASHLAQVADGLEVSLQVVEVDDKTQTLEVTVSGTDLDLEQLGDAISALGASLHSVDGVRVINDTDS